MGERLEPDYVYEPERDDPMYVCFDCRWNWVPEGTWESDGEEVGEVFVPYESECPNCGSYDTDEWYG